MASLTIKTSLGSKEVRRRFASLPKIIAGQQPDPLGVRRMFFAVLARRLYELIHEAYRTKSAGGTDSLGNTWRALRPRTIRKRLSPSFLALYPQSAKLLINRVTDRLFNSLAPGRISGSNYIPPAEQTYLLRINELLLGSEVPYAGAVHTRRRLWPARMKAWLQDAVATALDHVLLYTARSLEHA